MAGLWQVLEATLNLSLIGLKPLAQGFFFMFFSISSQPKGFLRSNYRITLWWE